VTTTRSIRGQSATERGSDEALLLSDALGGRTIAVSTHRPAAAHDGIGVSVFVLSGIVGGAVAAPFAWGALTGRVPPSFAFDPYLSVTPLVIVTAAAIGGVLGGWFIAALALSRTPGMFRCPQCGSASDLKWLSCRACGLSFG
jgi:hypothetical protein